MAAKSKNKVGAPKGNKNAEKWTEQTVMDAVQSVHSYCKDNKTPFLGIALNSLDYSHQRWSDWTKKFKDSQIVLDAIKKTEQLVEANLVEGGIKGDFNSTMAIFTLKNKHGWEDKRKNENTGANGGPIKIEGYTLITPNDET